MTVAAAPTLPSAGSVRARARTENFSVASLLLGRRTRERLLAIYDYARYIDELGDTVAGDRLAALDTAEREVARAFAGTATDPVFRNLTPTIRTCSLGPDPFLRLIEANRRDQVQRDYATFDELVAYCDLSANPVGELVLAIFGARTPERIALSNDVCTALQIAEHLQDVGEDARNGRIYLPREDRDRFGVVAGDLHASVASEPLRRLLAWETARARKLLDSGVALARSLRGRARFAIAGYVGGGFATLAALDRAGYDVLTATPTATSRQKLRATLGVLKETL